MMKREERLGLTKLNYQGCLMKIIEYINCDNIIIEFDDKYKAKIKSHWSMFKEGCIKNPYCPTVYNVGMIGMKYKARKDATHMHKEYKTWCHMLERCYDVNYAERQSTYKDVTCCEEWLLYENFYEWLHSQANFEQWLNGKNWALDKDILIKGNKIYSPETCCLVPQEINNLFTKNNVARGNLPIGVSYSKSRSMFIGKYIYGKNKKHSKQTEYGYPTPEDAFYLGYKPSKEAYIKQVAQEEYDKGNITKRCYEAMMNYEVEITD